MLGEKIRTNRWNAASQGTIPVGTWSHVVARYDGAEMSLFINGVKDANVLPRTGNLATTTALVELGRGWLSGVMWHFYDGLLDDVSIYAHALSDSEIAQRAQGYEGRYEYQHANALGSVILMTDQNQNVIARYEYDAFGAVRAETGTSDNTRKFTGKEWEADSKLYYFAARYYDPYIGRFTQRDPAGQGMNWYIYCANNPLKFVDPTGMDIKTTDQLSASAIKELSSIASTGNYVAPAMIIEALTKGRWKHYTIVIRQTSPSQLGGAMGRVKITDKGLGSVVYEDGRIVGFKDDTIVIEWNFQIKDVKEVAAIVAHELMHVVQFIHVPQLVSMYASAELGRVAIEYEAFQYGAHVSKALGITPVIPIGPGMVPRIYETYVRRGSVSPQTLQTIYDTIGQRSSKSIPVWKKWWK